MYNFADHESLGYKVFDYLILGHLRDKSGRQNIQSNFRSSSLPNNGQCASISEIKYQILKLNFFLTCKLSVILFIMSNPYAFLLWKMSTCLLALAMAYKMHCYNMIETFATILVKVLHRNRSYRMCVCVYMEREREIFKESAHNILGLAICRAESCRLETHERVDDPIQVRRQSAGTSFSSRNFTLLLFRPSTI